MVKSVRKKSADHITLHIELPAKPRKRPHQERSVRMADALKETGWDILQKEGRGSLTLEQLSQRSGVAVSSIYEYFPTMDSLVAAIYEDNRTKLYRGVVDGLQALPPSAKLFEGIMLLLRFGLAFLHTWTQIDREFFTRSAHYDELVRLAILKAEHSWMYEAGNALINRFPDEIQVLNREKTLFLIFQTTLAIPRSMVLVKPEYLSEPDTQLLLARMLHGLLTPPD